MKCITEVELINFQCHSHFKEKFGMFTAIVGPSDKGKTAVYRGIKWCLYNEPPRGRNGVVKRGEKQATAIVRFSDGTEIKRSKGEYGNTYDILYSDGRTLHMKDVGSGPIDEVVMAHEMRPLDLFSKQEILNMRDQLANPFFLGETPTNKTVMIGKIAKTSVIDLAIKNASSEVRIKNGELKKYKAKLKVNKTSLKEIPNLERMEKDIDKAEDKIEAIEYAENKIKNIKSAIDSLEKFNNKKEELKNIIEAEKPVNEVINDIEGIISLQNKINQLNKIIDKINSYEKKKAEVQDFINDVSLEDINNVLNDIDKIISISNDIKDIKIKKKELNENLKTMNKLKELPQLEVVDSTLNDIDECIEIAKSISKINPVNDRLKKELSRKVKGVSIIKDLKEKHILAINSYKEGLINNKVCPVCMSPMTKEHVHDIEKYI